MYHSFCHLSRKKGTSIRATVARIHLAHLRHNLHALRARTGAAICAAVKANAYGHGAVEISRELVRQGTEMLCVATVDEGRELREAGLTLPILLLGPASPEDLLGIARWQLAPLASDQAYIKALAQLAAETGTRLEVHLKVDVGMGRLGCPPEQAVALAHQIVHSLHLDFSGLCTHFPSSDNGQAEPTRSHLATFNAVLAAVRAAGFQPRWIHTANSGALLDFPEAHFNLVRPGILLYGYAPSPETVESAAEGPGFLPVMELVSGVSFLKYLNVEAPLSYGSTWLANAGNWVATIPAGYADGYSRLLSSRGQVRIGPQLYPVAGRVCMDQFLVDLGPGTPPPEWAEVILFGPQGPTAADIAQLVGSIPYEVTCLITQRVPRIYLP